jgi:hypothetical protein
MCQEITRGFENVIQENTVMMFFKGPAAKNFLERNT